jgi:septal ring factor EnvC (AmiA/AmiB activator)
MKELDKYIVGLVLFMFLLPFSGIAQTKASLEEKKKKLEHEIRETNKLIEATKKDKTLSLSQLTILNKKIKDRQELIKVYNSEISLLNKSIKNNDKEISNLQQDMKMLKETYAHVIRKAYINRGKHVPIIYIFASKDFNQAFRRLRYLQSYNEFRRKQAIEIQNIQDTLNKKIVELRIDLDSKRVLLNNEQTQQNELGKEKTEKETAVKTLSKKENQLKKELDKKRANAKKLDAEIARVIEAEIRKERERAAAAAAKAAAAKGEKAPAANVMKVSPETKLVSDKFESNKGRLPWPVDKGVITEQFGEHRHPVMANIVINNNGINIATTKGASIKAIFEGEVAAVFTVPGGNKAVIVRHGEYLSVYSNLGDIVVKQGDKVKVGQVLGSVYTDDDDNKTEAHLEIWKDKTKLNPEIWIAR